MSNAAVAVAYRRAHHGDLREHGELLGRGELVNQGPERKLFEHGRGGLLLGHRRGVASL